MSKHKVIKNISIDMGSGSVRIHKNYYKNKKIISKEIIRFKTFKIIQKGRIMWDYKKIFNNIILSLSKLNEDFESLSVNGWGCDYVLLDKDFNIISNPTTYRDSSLENIVANFGKKFKFPFKKIYMLNGHIISKISSVMQLYRDFNERKSTFEKAVYFLNIPDLINFMLTGKINNEISIFSTSGLLFQGNKPSEYKFLSKIKIDINDSLKTLGFIKKDLKNKLKIGNPEVISIASHDTSSGIASLDMKDNDIFLSLGSWNIMGFISNEPIINDFCYANNITNEISAYKKYKVIKNMNGLFLLQKLLEFSKVHDPNISFKKLTQLAKREKGFTNAIDIDGGMFHLEKDIFKQIDKYFKLQKCNFKDKNLGIYAIVIYNGIVNSIEKTYKILNKVLDEKNEKLFIFGGGIQDGFLIEMIKKRINKKIIICSEEATSIGNSIQQLIYKNHIEGPHEVKKIVLKK